MIENLVALRAYTNILFENLNGHKCLLGYCKKRNSPINMSQQQLLWHKNLFLFASPNCTKVNRHLFKTKKTLCCLRITTIKVCYGCLSIGGAGQLKVQIQSQCQIYWERSLQYKKGNKEVAIQTQILPPCVFPCKWAETGLLLFHLLIQLPGQQLEPGHAGGPLDYWSQFYQVNRKITVSKLSQFEKDMNCSVSKYWYYAKFSLFTDIRCRVNQRHLC